MIIILSPSKTLGNIEVNHKVRTTQPDFLDQSEMVVNRLRKLKVDDLKDLMSISQDLARLNYERYLKWQIPFNEQNSYPEIGRAHV